MKSIAPVAPMIGKLIPRLATDHDGEVVATVRAIQRTLASAGADLHDLASAIQADQEASIRGHGPRDQSAVFWSDLGNDEKHSWLHALYYHDLGLTDWEFDFVSSVMARTKHAYAIRISERQEAVLDRLLWKAVSQGVRV